MTTLTETRHAGGFLVWEARRNYCRSTVVLERIRFTRKHILS